MHRRAAIRQAVVALLDGATAAGANVTAGRVNPDQIPSLPGLNVLTGAEGTEPAERVAGGATGSLEQLREVAFQVELRVAAADDLDDVLDALALEVEVALGADRTLDALASWFTYDGFDDAELVGDLELPIGLLALRYVALYRVDLTDPQ